MTHASLVRSISISVEKGTTKTPVERALFVTGHGIEDDAHAGSVSRQVSILSFASIRRMEESFGSPLGGGRFGENLVLEGCDLSGAIIGDAIILDDHVVLEITEIGKECHQGCEIRRVTGDCIMPKEGLFCRVVRGGEIRAGVSARLVPGPVLDSGTNHRERS